MPHLLLFAHLRELAGASRATFEGASSKEVVDRAVARFGPEFEAMLPYCKTYVAGVEVTGDVALREQDEIALLPPVSGGCD